MAGSERRSPSKKVTGAADADAGDTASNAGVRAGLGAVMWAIRIPLIAWILYQAYVIRLYAIQNYGLVIHEFDPWFNFRATQYLACLLYTSPSPRDRG